MIEIYTFYLFYYKDSNRCDRFLSESKIFVRNKNYDGKI